MKRSTFCPPGTENNVRLKYLNLKILSIVLNYNKFETTDLSQKQPQGTFNYPTHCTNFLLSLMHR